MVGNMHPWPTGWVSTASLLLFACTVNVSRGHEHHGEEIPEGHTVTQDPIDAILWTHIIIQTAAWGVLYPLGMVLGLVKSRFHVPVQVLASVLAIVGYFLGHSHKGRQFSPSAHSGFANWLMLLVIGQVALGGYLRLHLERGLFGKSRGFFVRIHKVLGITIPLAAWVQMLFGGIAMEGFCHADHLGQCLAHFIMGSAFIAYGIVLLILLLVGQVWLQRRRRSQEFFDSSLIAAWGCVNTFTEHRWGHEWAHNDIQHTSMGIVWWAAGLVGMWLSRDSNGRPKRNVIPGMVIFITGWAMSSHPQHLQLSTMMHSVFGYTLMAAGLARIIEISFVLRDRASVTELNEHTGVTPGESGSPEHESHSWQYLTPYLLFAGGFLFMGATEEQMAMLSDAGIDHVSYILILYSVAFVLFLFTLILIRIFATKSPGDSKQTRDSESAPMLNGHAINGHAHAAERGTARDAEEFELDGLISDEEDAREIGNSDGDDHDSSYRRMKA
ncbi:Protein YTP1 [Sphaceloma murrayae]|uniref:Protein YTP1 n=1 Tax=Sphaceloma murrayae TaxID=2082308 RepID=A0A2K1QL05_9PEZI|nr:Protein YTP1 [Sphaceloma murrayae]